MSGRAKVDPTPFLATLRGTAPIATLVSALPVAARKPVDEVATPWTPRRDEPPAPPPVPAKDPRIIEEELAWARDEAIAQGRADGLAETAALRAKLARAVDDLAQVREVKLDELADAIGGLVGSIVQAWIGASERTIAFAPIVRGWLASPSAHAAAVARVHPSDVDALRDALGPAAPTSLQLDPDPTVAPGDLTIRSAEHELVHSWQARIAELHEAVAAAVMADLASTRDVQVG